MSTVILKKPRPMKDKDGKDYVAKAGETISLPFVAAKEAVAKGEAEYPAGASATPAAADGEVREALAAANRRADDATRESAALRDENARLAAEVERLAAENGELAATLEAATKPSDGPAGGQSNG